MPWKQLGGGRGGRIKGGALILLLCVGVGGGLQPPPSVKGPPCVKGPLVSFVPLGAKRGGVGPW